MEKPSFVMKEVLVAIVNMVLVTKAGYCKICRYYKCDMENEVESSLPLGSKLYWGKLTMIWSES